MQESIISQYLIVPNRGKAIFYAKKALAQIVTDVVNLEDINYTVPEVQTLLDGITVGGHKIQDELITNNQINAWRFLFNSLDNNTFAITKDYVFKLHDLVARQEALLWGHFRNAHVSIAGTDYKPPAAKQLDSLWDELLLSVKQLEQQSLASSHAAPDKQNLIYHAATLLFARMAKLQFFFDGNKRTARMMMSGMLLNAGYPMINVSGARKLEFNQAMINYYNTDNLIPLQSFLYSCLDVDILQEFS